jgi:SOS-response transcriptional repressor LexA
MVDRKPTIASMTVGERIRAARERLKMSQVTLAKKVGVSRGAIYNWEYDLTDIRKEKVPRLASVLGLDPSALSPFGGGTVAPIDKDRKSNYVVLLNWNDLIHLGVGGKMKMSALKRPGYIEVDIDISPECRALRIEDNSMEIIVNGRSPTGVDSFHKGDIIILDPNIDPRDGDYVLVRIKQTSEHVFRLYVPRARGAYDLVAGNPDYPTLTINNRFPADLIGVLVEHRRKRHS